MAAGVGLEPTTTRLTAAGSAVELPGNIKTANPFSAFPRAGIVGRN